VIFHISVSMQRGSAVRQRVDSAISNRPQAFGGWAMPHTRSLLAAVAVVGLGAFVAPTLAAPIDSIDLSDPGTSQNFTDSFGALFSLTATQPAGSGVFLPFVRIQNNGQEQGYNSVDTKNTMDDINLPGNTSYLLAMNNVVNDSGSFQLKLDYNEPGNAGKSTIYLEDLTIVISTDPNKVGPASTKGNFSVQSIPFSAGDVVAYHMGDATNPASSNGFHVVLNADANPASGNGGSGSADLDVTVPLLPNLRALVDANHYAYVYSRFSSSQAGYEEWSSFYVIPPNSSGGAPVPEPASLGLLAAGLLTLLASRKK